MFCFFSDSTDLSLKCEDSKALSLQRCDFFQKISRSNLCLTDPWQLQISLFLSLLALHLVEKLSDSHLYQAAQAFIMCMHTDYPIWCTPQSMQAAVFKKRPGSDDKKWHVAVIYAALFLVFVVQNLEHFKFISFTTPILLYEESRRCDAWRVSFIIRHMKLQLLDFFSRLRFKTTRFYN